MDTNTTRRNLLRIGTTAVAYAAGAAAVTGGVAIVSQAKGATLPGISHGMAQAVANLAAAERTANHYDATVYESARSRWLAAKEALPHVVLEPCEDWRMAPDFWSTDNPQALKIAKNLVRDNARATKTDDVIRARKLIAADRRRDRALERLGKTSGIAAARNESDRLSDLLVAAEDAVCAYPARKLADIEAKLAFFVERGLAQNEGNVALVLADARRLHAKEGR